MILSVSRRTDIPAFYSEWFFNRVKAGFADVINPFNANKFSRVPINPEIVDCIVFWTKDAAPMIERLDELKNFKYYFQFSVTPYDEEVEPGLWENQNKKKIIWTFKNLSETIGKDKVIWRYDPIIYSEKFTADWHFDQFEFLLKNLAPYTNRCVISFVDLYKKTQHNTKPLGLIDLTEAKMKEIALGFSQIAEGSGVEIQSCSEKVDLAEFGIKHGACIDREIVEKVIGAKLDLKKVKGKDGKDATQRTDCGCIDSVDIGEYDTCKHLCAYCYANFRPNIAIKNNANHNPKNSSMTRDFSDEKNVPFIKKAVKLKRVQPSLFGDF